MTQQIISSETVPQEELSEQTMQFISNGSGQLDHSRLFWENINDLFKEKKKLFHNDCKPSFHFWPLYEMMYGLLCCHF
jgi:hypothetical protein